MTYPNTFSEAAWIAPVVLTTENSQGKLYAQSKNSFLHFSTDDDNMIKRAAIRSASADRVLSKRKDTLLSSSEDVPSISNTSTDANEIPYCEESGESIYSNIPCDTQPNLQYFLAEQYMYMEGEDCMYMYGNETNEIYDEDCMYANETNETCEVNPLQNVNHIPRVVQPRFNPQASVGDGLISQISQTSQPDSQAKVVKPRKNRKNLPSTCSASITTLMIRGIPCSFSQENLLEWIDNSGFQGMYDFFYLPRCGNSESNLGYAFINFAFPSNAKLFQLMQNGVMLNPRNSAKVCSISPADIQGVGQLRKHFRRTAVSYGSKGPLFMQTNGKTGAQGMEMTPRSADGVLSQPKIEIGEEGLFCADPQVDDVSTDVDEIASSEGSGGSSTPRNSSKARDCPLAACEGQKSVAEETQMYKVNPLDDIDMPYMVEPRYDCHSMALVSDSPVSDGLVSESPASKKLQVTKPARKNRKNLAGTSSDNVTSLMIRGLPCSFTQESLLERIDSYGFHATYDFFYLPRCGNSESNLGYAFINFVCPSHARNFQNSLDGVMLNPKNSKKVCSISAADIQGLAQLRKHFRRTAVSYGSKGPLFIRSGRPACTKEDMGSTEMSEEFC